MKTTHETLIDLADRYVELHARKEDLFWTARMGLSADREGVQKDLSAAEIEVNRFLQDPERLRALRDLESSGAGSEAERRILAGWIAMFSAHTIESAEARASSEEVVELEGALQTKRTGMDLGYEDPATGGRVQASSVKLALLVRTDPDPAKRRAAFDGLRSIEPFVLSAGFLEIVKRRNRLARSLGYEDYYDWRVRVVERMTKREVFDVLEDLARRTEAKARAELADFAARHGAGALDPWNFLYLRAGKLTEKIDPYFPFEESLARWARTFAGLAIRFAGATLTLDLVDRTGKYENGFMHGPGLAWLDRGRWRPARINFSANAVPGQVGSGLRATQTLFHEGGHAAHFANIRMDAPCFSHEFAPTSVAYAETQSMFLDSLLSDADWRAANAADSAGRPIPFELQEEAIREKQPMLAWDIRAWLSIPFAERALYEIPEEDLSPERVLETFRRIERETQGLSSGVRPILSVPHLLAGESSAYYHGYILAEMAVHQTRRFFLERDGHIADNSRVGEDLARCYWAPGNSISFSDALRSLTGSGLSADALVTDCNRTTSEALSRARESVARGAGRSHSGGRPELDATVRVIHGNELVATTESGGLEGAGRAFARWIADRTAAAAPPSPAGK